MKWDLVIFDCDGVLVDSEAISNGTLVEMLGELGLKISLEVSAGMFMGRSMAAIMEMAEKRFDVSLPEGFLEQYYLRMDVAFNHDLQSIPGIFEALDRITLTSCVASSGPHRKMATTLGVTGLLDRFEGRIFSAADVGRGKPFPDLFLHAASRMRVDPSRCVVVEDAVPGVQAAVAAGMSVFGYAKRTPPKHLREAGAEVFDDMADLPGLLGL